MLKHKKSLDKDKTLEQAANNYDSVDLEKSFDFSKAKLQPGKIKRVNMQLPFVLYYEALKLGQLSGTGYQNALKMAIAIGLKQLDKDLSKKI